MPGRDSRTKTRRQEHRHVGTPVLLQFDKTECGAVCLGIVLAHHGRWVRLEELPVMTRQPPSPITAAPPSIVMVDFINRERRRGGTLMAAVQEAVAARMRPILLTSITTFAGLAPLLLEQGAQADFLKPMAISLAFGALFATVVTLVLVPAAYLVLDDVERLAELAFPRRDAAR